MAKKPEISLPVRTLTATVLQWFVDREQGLRRFRDMLAGQDPALALLVWGPTGIGKTWLLRRLHHEAETLSFPVSDIDFALGEALDDLLMIHRIALALGSRHFGTLNRTLEKATELQVVLKIESSPGGGGVTFLGDTEIHGDVAGRDIIKGNTFNLQADSPETRRIWQERINEAFFADLERLGLAKGAVLQFDSFEMATKEANSWVENRLLGRIGEGKLPGVRVVIAGERVPRLPSAWRGLVAELRLRRLPAAEVRRYLRDKRQLVISEANVATIYDITDGRPNLVALIAESNPKELPEQPDVDRLLEILIEGILEQADPPIPETLRVAAIAVWFDAALLADLLRTPTGVDDRLADLQVYSFVYADERGHLHFSPTVRQILLETWEEQQTEFRELNNRAARHFDERAHNAADPREREELERQAVGHWLVIDERAGRDRLRALFEENEVCYRLAACELLLQRAEAVGSLTDLTQDWVRYLQGQLALARNDYARSAEFFDALLEKIDPGSELHALAGWGRGQVAAEQGEWAQAIERYKDSLRYFQGQVDRAREGQVMLALGDVHLQQARALGGPIRPQLLRRRGRGRFVEAIPAFLVALPFVVYAWAIRRWRFLPPLHHGMNYRNWTLVRLLLTAVRWYRDAESAFVETRQEAFLVNARQRLAQTYHRLGWWHTARRLFDQVLRSGPVVTNAYRQAQVRKEFADTELAAGHTDEAIEELKDSLQIFERYQDGQAQAQAQALLGQAWMQKGDFEHGLALFRESLEGFSSIDDHLGIGLALHALRRWVRSANPTPKQAGEIEELIVSTRERTYLPRVQDRLAALMELVVSLGFLVLVIIGLIRLGMPVPLTPMPEIWANILSIDTWLGVLSYSVLFAWILTVGSGLLGLILIMLGTRQKLEPERLDRITTSNDAVTRYDYRNQEMTRIPWHEVRAILSVERVFWRRPIPLLSWSWLFGPKTAIQVLSSDAVRTSVSTTPNSIAFLPISYLDKSVKALPIDGVEATQAIVRPFNMLTKGEPSGVVKAWLDFILSNAGQAIVAEEGHIPVKGTAVAPTLTVARLSGQIRVAGSTAMQPLIERLAKVYSAQYPDVRIDVQGNGSNVGIRLVGQGNVDIGAVSREVKPSELDEYKNLKTFTIAQDGIAIVAQPEVPVDELTKDQVKNIFAGKITNWKDVGGPDNLIVVVAPQEGSRIRATFEEMVMGKDRLVMVDPAIRVPAAMLWYDALKRDIEDHLREHGVQPIRHHLDVHVLRSWLGLFFVLCPVLLGLGSLIVWNLVDLPLPLGLATLVGPALIFLGAIALVAGLYWWLVLYPLWMRYTLKPRSRMPLAIGGLGFIIVAFAFYLSYQYPYFPMRHWLDGTVHPLGFLLIIIAPLWVLGAREWKHKLVARGKAVYPPWIRVVAATILLGAVLLTGLFVQRAGSYAYILPMVTHLSHGDYEGTIDRCTRALEMNDGLADGYFFRALAYTKIGEYQLAVEDLSHLINSPGPTITHYRWYRAKAYRALDNSKAACADIESALSAQRWRLSRRDQEEAQSARQEWNCTDFADIEEDSEGSSS